ncbi:ExbD/TolR family protein [Fodinicurvata fenggangensis]|uniref:ExbD/TolR family protein n=1 Tax=Fodinicurvata fenggangensis TaxID=1121830 RepID=UPI000550D498|nr:biopolymer transporter ExbD [Fodinicurvata fenggangensis]
MRIASPKPRNIDSEAGVLPLINIVFLLLIFFMLAGQLSASDPLAVEPPESLSDSLPEEQTLTLSVAEDGRMMIDDTQVTLDQLADEISANLAQETATNLEVKADSGLDSARLVQVMTRLRQAGIEQVTLLTNSRR